MPQPAQHPAITVGPARLRLHLGDWEQLERAAGEGLLDEHTYVELKLALPPAGKNVETARDLASFGVLGGVLVVGIKDAGGGKAGQVVGVDDAQATRERLVAIADGAVQPPLPCDVFVIDQPDQPERGCVVCVVQPSSQAPHRADERYWGRSSTGKRVLADPEVAALFADRRNLADRFRDDLIDLENSFDPVPSNDRRGGHLYLAAKPKHALPEPPSWAQSDSVLGIIGGAVQGNDTGWPDFGGALYSIGHPSGVMAQSFPGGEQPGEEASFVKILIKDDGSIHAVSGLGTFEQETRDRQSKLKIMVVPAVAVQVDQFVRATGLVAERQGVWGSWTVGLRVTDLLGTRSQRDTYSVRMGGATTIYPEPEYLMVTEATTEELRNRPQDIVQRLLQPLARGFAETRLFPYTDPYELSRR